MNDLDSLWPDQTPFDVVWYGVLLIVLYSLVFTACVIGMSNVSLSPSLSVSMSASLDLGPERFFSVHDMIFCRL